MILIPEMPYDLEKIAEFLLERRRHGKRFIIVVVAEGAMAIDDARLVEEILAEKQAAKSKAEKKKASGRLEDFHQHHLEHTLHLTKQLESMTGQESRLTILGHLQARGDAFGRRPVAGQSAGNELRGIIAQGAQGVMIAARGEGVAAVPLEDVAGKKKLVATGHPLVQTARLVGTDFGC